MDSNNNSTLKNNRVVYATIGSFDGIHIGHQHLINSMVHQSSEDHAETVVVTFHPHPAVILKSIPMPFYITSPDEKKEVLQSLGVDHVFCLKFTKEMSGYSPEQFLDLILDEYPINQFWLGEDFALGKNRSGNIEVLEKIGKEKGFSITQFSHLQHNGEKISSSAIRNWILEGEFPNTTKALNRYYSIQGNVYHGDSRGRKLGFPTANLEVWKGKLLPAPGVYATWIDVDNSLYPSVTNVGLRPTFENQESRTTIETFIHDFSRDIYGNHVKLHFVEKIRSEKKFDSIELLINQIQKDVKQSEEILKHANKPTGLFT
jgi:riboflavin kinase/FMN adenylyltransferase